MQIIIHDTPYYFVRVAYVIPTFVKFTLGTYNKSIGALQHATF